MAQKWVCDLVAQLLEEDGQGIYDYFLNRRSFLKSYYKDFDMKAFIGNKMNDIFNDPKNYDPKTDRLTMQGKAQMKNEIVALLEDEQALISKFSGKYDINSVSFFARMDKWSKTPQTQWSVWEDNLIRGYETTKGETYFKLNSTLDTEVTLKSGRKAQLSANQLFEKPEFKEAFMELIIKGNKRIENLDSSVSGKLVDYNDIVKRYIVSNRTIGDVDLAMASMAFDPNKMVKDEGGLSLFGNIISGNKRRNFTSKEVDRAVESFVEENGDLFRTKSDAKAVGYMLLGWFDNVAIRSEEGIVMSKLNKTPQGKFKFFNRIVNQGYTDKETMLKIALKYADSPDNIYSKINNAMANDIATTKMFGRKPFMALENAKKIADTVLEAGKEKSDFVKATKRMEELMNAMFNPGKVSTLDDKLFQLANLGGTIIKANRITGAGLRTMGDATLGGLKFSMFTGDSFASSALKAIGITGMELEGKVIRNLGEGVKRVSPNSLAEYIDEVTKKFDFSMWAKMTDKERRELTEVMLGTMADTVTRTGMYDGTWTPLTAIASKKGFRENGIKGVATSWSSNFSFLQLKETIGNVNSYYFSKKFRTNLVKYYNDPVINKYMNDLGFTEDAYNLFRKLGGDTEYGNRAELDLRKVDWFQKRGDEYKKFMRDFFVPEDMDKLRPEQIGMILDMVSVMRQGDILKFDNEGTLSKVSKQLLFEEVEKRFPDVYKKLEINDFEIRFQPDTHSAHVSITGDGFLKGGLAEDKQLRYAIRQTYEAIREQEMRVIKETVKAEYLDNGKVLPSKRNEVKDILMEMYGGRKTDDGVEYRWGRKEDYFVANYYLDKFKDFERALFYEFASVKPSLSIRIVNDALKKQDNRLGLILSNSLAFKSASLDALYKYKNLMGKMGSHMRKGKMFSGKKMAMYADAITAIGLIALINGIAGDAYDKVTDKDTGEVVDIPDLTRKGAGDVTGFAFASLNPSVVQTFWGRVKQRPVNEIIKQMFTNDVLVNKFTKDLLGEMSRAYGLERKKEKRLKERRGLQRERAKKLGRVNPITGKVKKRERRK